MVLNNLLEIYDKFNNTEYSLYLIVIIALFGNNITFFRDTYEINIKKNNQVQTGILKFIQQFLSQDSKNISRIKMDIDSTCPKKYIKKILKHLRYYNTSDGEISQCIHGEELRVKEEIDMYMKKKHNSNRIITESILIHDLHCPNTDYEEKGVIVNRTIFYDLFPQRINLPVSWERDDYLQYIQDIVNRMNDDKLKIFLDWILSNFEKEIYSSVRKITSGYIDEDIDTSTLIKISNYLNNMVGKYKLNGFRKSFLTNNTNVLIVPIEQELDEILYIYKYDETNFPVDTYEKEFNLRSIILYDKVQHYVVFNIDKWFMYKDSKLTEIEEYKEYLSKSINDIKIMIYDR